MSSANNPATGAGSGRPGIPRLSLPLGSAWAGPAVEAGLIALALGAATAAAMALEQLAGLPDASPVYLVAVVLAAGLSGMWAAVGTSVIAFVLYDFLFTTPRFSLTVSSPEEWLSLLLFLLVAVVIGRMAARLRDRVDEADRRVREGVALVAMSREVAMTTSFDEAAGAVTDRLLEDAEMAGVWVTLDADGGRVIGQAGMRAPDGGGAPWILARSTQDETTTWIRLYGGDRAVPPTADSSETGQHYVVPIEGADRDDAWLHTWRAAGDPRPGRGARRLLALAADQLGIALRRDELREELTAAEVASQSDALRAAILDSVSHDLRTPIATIRALAGGMADSATPPDPAQAQSTATAIDTEATRLGELVSGLLDMGRVQAGALRADLDPCDVEELVETALHHRGLRPDDGRLTVEITAGLPPVLADPVLFDVVLGNVLDNAVVHAPEGTAIRVRAVTEPPAGDPGGPLVIRLDVDDAGAGVPADALAHLFDRFYRVPAEHEPARRGLGMGLAIARGFVETMNGTIDAEPSPLGGLGIRIRLPAALDQDAEQGDKRGDDHGARKG